MGPQIIGRPQPSGRVHLADQGRQAVTADVAQQARMFPDAGYADCHLDVCGEDPVDIDTFLLLHARVLGGRRRGALRFLRLRATGPSRLLGTGGSRRGPAGRGCLLPRTAGFRIRPRPATVLPAVLSGGALPGFRYVPGCNPAQGITVFPAEVNLVCLAIEAERPGLDVVRVAAYVTGEFYLSDSRHRRVPNRSVSIVSNPATRPGRGHAFPLPHAVKAVRGLQMNDSQMR